MVIVQTTIKTVSYGRRAHLINWKMVLYLTRMISGQRLLGGLKYYLHHLSTEQNLFSLRHYDGVLKMFWGEFNIFVITKLFSYLFTVVFRTYGEVLKTFLLLYTYAYYGFNFIYMQESEAEHRALFCKTSLKISLWLFVMFWVFQIYLTYRERLESTFSLL